MKDDNLKELLKLTPLDSQIKKIKINIKFNQIKKIFKKLLK